MTRSPNMLMSSTGRPSTPEGSRGPSRGLTGGYADQQPDIYDELDKGLEYVPEHV